MRNWKLTLSYDGGAFHGWQVQPGLPTIQGELQSAIHRVLGESPLPQGSGRTDAGVHALGQVASFLLHAPIPPGNLKRSLNRTLPAAIRVLDAAPAPDAFHARHSAVAKTYEYRIFRGELCSPFLAQYVHACRWKLDMAALRQAAQDVVGEHDFVSLAASDPDSAGRDAKDDAKNDEQDDAQDDAQDDEQDVADEDAQDDAESSGQSRTPSRTPSLAQSTVRAIFSSEWQERPDGLLVYRVRGSGFLHHMVRNLVGTMLEIGRGQFRPGSMPAILAARSRSAAGPTAPARGLFLHSVEYPPQSLRCAGL